MSNEVERTIELEITARATIPEERYGKFLDLLKEVSVEPVSLQITEPDGQTMLFELPHKKFPLDSVTLEEAHYVQKHFIEDDTPNNVSTSAFRKILEIVPEDQLRATEQGVPGVDTKTAVDTCRKLLFGSSRIKGPKTRGFLQALLSYGESKLEAQQQIEN